MKIIKMTHHLRTCPISMGVARSREVIHIIRMISLVLVTVHLNLAWIGYNIAYHLQ